MANFILIDTATKKLSLSLFQEKKCIGTYIDESDYSHARNITIQIEKLVLNAELRFDQISAIVINKGPGSFTGLRVGSSIAKGLSFALDIPLISIDGLEAYGLYFYNKLQDNFSDIFILLDARRENYFYSHIKNGEIYKKTSFGHITDIETDIYLSRAAWINNSSKDNFEELKSEYLIDTAIKKWETKAFEDISNFEPNYMLNNYTSSKA